MSREATSTYIPIRVDNLIISVECITSKCYSKILGILVTSTQRFIGSIVLYFYAKSYLTFHSMRINQGLRSYYFYSAIV